MYKKNKLFILLFASIGLLNLNVFADSTTQTVKKSIVNSYDMKNSVYIDVPYGVSIKEIRTDNGTVLPYTINKYNGTVLVTVTDGNTNEVYNPKKYSSLVNKTIVEDYETDLPSYTSVSDGDYSGSISLSSTTTTTKSKSVKGNASVVEDFYWRCDNVGVLTPNKSYDPTKPDEGNNHKYSYSGASWSGNHRNFDELASYISSNWSGVPDYYGGISLISYSDSDGYSGKGSATLSEPPIESEVTPYSDLYIPAPENGWVLPTQNKRANHYSIRYRYTLEATVSKTAYEGYYKGYIYKGGYDDVYTYNLTVTYEEDNLDIYTMYSTDWTNQDLNISLSSNSYFFSYFRFDGLIKNIKPATYSVPSNGVYTFYVLDYGHGRAIRQKPLSIIVKNIDKTIPYGTYSPNSRTVWDGDINVNFSAFDSGGSGVKRWRYCVSVNNGTSYGPYSNYYTTSSENILLNNDGKNKIKVEIEDVAGNINYVYSGTYYVDKTPPELTFSPDGCDWTNLSVISNWEAIDDASLVKGYKFRIKNTNGYVASITDWSNLDISNIKTLIYKEGYSSVEVMVEDNARNSKTYLSKPFKIDKTAPTLNVNVESFIKDTFKEIPINLSNVRDNLVGVRDIELSLFVDFSKKISIPYIDDVTSYDVFLPRYGLSFDQVLYVKVTDLLGNERTYTKNIYLDPLPPEIPNIYTPVEDILLVNSEKLNVKWDYEDPGSFKLLKTELIFVNKDKGKTVTITIVGEDVDAYLDPALEDGVYNLMVKVYNTENKSTLSKTVVQIRKNRFKIQGNLYSKEINVAGSPIKFVKIDLDVAEQNVKEIASTIKSHTNIYIVLPEDNGTFDLTNTTKVLPYNLNSNSDAFRIPGNSVNKIMVLIKMKSDDTEYSRITPWLDSISVSVR